jgi:hypothetical protein
MVERLWIALFTQFGLHMQTNRREKISSRKVQREQRNSNSKEAVKRVNALGRVKREEGRRELNRWLV